MTVKKGLKRAEARLGHDQMDWLDKRSAETGISKSSLIQLAVENYIQQKQSMDTLGQLVLQIERLEEHLQDAEK